MGLAWVQGDSELAVCDPAALLYRTAGLGMPFGGGGTHRGVVDGAECDGPNRPGQGFAGACAGSGGHPDGEGRGAGDESNTAGDWSAVAPCGGFKRFTGAAV